MPQLERLPTDYSRGRKDYQRFVDFLAHCDGLDEDEAAMRFAEFAEILSPETPLVYVTMEDYDGKKGLKGGGGLGVLAGDTARACEELGLPLVTITANYPKVTRQIMDLNRSKEYREDVDPSRLYKCLGKLAVNTASDPEIPIEVFARTDGSVTTITLTDLTEPGLGELYKGGNSSDHRLYQELVVGFGGYKALMDLDVKAAFIQLNEAPTVFLAIAWLDDLCTKGMPFSEAFRMIKDHVLYTNHTLVLAVEGEFGWAQFEHMVMPNIKSDSVKDWMRGLIKQYGGKLRLSTLAIDMTDTRTGVSKLHAEVSRNVYTDRWGKSVDFIGVTNGIAERWIADEVLGTYREVGALDEFGDTTPDYEERLDEVDVKTMKANHAAGRANMNDILARRKNHRGEPIIIPEDALVFDFKRRFVDYKRAIMIFADIDRLAAILNEQNGYIVITGKPHPSDDNMVDQLKYLLDTIDAHSILHDRVHYVVDYDEEVGLALSVGADCAINTPIVGKEACGTSWMKDIASYWKLLISTEDGGVADVPHRQTVGTKSQKPVESYLKISGNEYREEVESLYQRLEQACLILRDDTWHLETVAESVKAYLPTISSTRMIRSYLGLVRGMVTRKRERDK